MAPVRRRRTARPAFLAASCAAGLAGLLVSAVLVPGAGHAVGATDVSGVVGATGARNAAGTGAARGAESSVPVPVPVPEPAPVTDASAPAEPAAPVAPTTSPVPSAPGTPVSGASASGTPVPGTPVPSASGEAAPAPSAPSASAGAGEPAPGAERPAFGAYLDYGPRGVTRMAGLSRWLGGADLRVGHTYLPGDLWSNIEGAPGFLDAWAEWRRGGDDRLFVLNVPMLERNEERVPDAEVAALLRRGAAGEFDHHFRALAERLVGLGIPDTVLVPGWEMNGITYTHRCGPDPEAWKAYWNRIVAAMRAVPGQGFRFDFTPSRGRDAVPWTECYPGDDTVDVIGMDAYDQPRGLSFEEQVREPYGLRAHVDFARAHGKPVSYPEWGLFRNGDNATYMRGMLAWMDEHRPLYNTLTDYCPHGVWTCGDNPRAAAVYRSALFGRTDGDPVSPAPSRTPVPAPARPVPPRGCAPLWAGGWTAYWLGGGFCLRHDRWTRHRP
ncbi:glycoside hydrolase family 26 protein [Streptomyces minutiscleroticus]|uniref:glycoside hydrolase family 26 protein n=1 Tax=Streptomyces minutiscleroticus TaxID=68238 RepID=UPI00167F0E42